MATKRKDNPRPGPEEPGVELQIISPDPDPAYSGQSAPDQDQDQSSQADPHIIDAHVVIEVKDGTDSEVDEGSGLTLHKNAIIPISQIVKHPRNFRLHPEEQEADLIQSIQRFGQGRSVVVQEPAPGGKYLMVAGHGAMMAMQKLGFKKIKADILPADWNPRQIEGYLIADNWTQRKAQDDPLTLSQLFQDQLEAGFSLESIGSSQAEFQQLMEMAGDQLLEEADGPLFGGGGEGGGLGLEEERVQRGDIWQLGPNQLVCGDSAIATRLVEMFEMEFGKDALLISRGGSVPKANLQAGPALNSGKPKAGTAKKSQGQEGQEDLDSDLIPF